MDFQLGQNSELCFPTEKNEGESCRGFFLVEFLTDRRNLETFLLELVFSLKKLSCTKANGDEITFSIENQHYLLGKVTSTGVEV